MLLMFFSVNTFAQAGQVEKLNEEQKEQIKSIKEVLKAEVKQIRESDLSKEEKRAAIKEAGKKSDMQVKEILSEEQYQRYRQRTKKRMKARKQKRKDGDNG